MRMLHLATGLTLAAAASAAFAATPVRTPASYALKANTAKPAPVTEISLDNTQRWDADSFVRTLFDNRPDAQGRGNPLLNFVHQNGALVSQLDFSSVMTAAGADASLFWRRIGPSSSGTQAQRARPDGQGTTSLRFDVVDGPVTGEFFFHAARNGYWEVLRSGGYYGAGGFFNVPGEYRSGGFGGGMATMRFENNQDVGSARMLYNFVNDGGENGTVRARLLYLDRNGEDGYNKIRFTYVSNPLRPVSPH